ncbi:DUF6055 domain-containing protein [Glycomyces xiaoerkulensis]|uniref:DUF6055 domain-containing protein n=1 Tax=Glycomyces xiaoerkulensis TaxID=2038139 RepID=UPI000C261252|nr:DUF6055 domain-containing protein [Glycomyces xiaoerkulensis]
MEAAMTRLRRGRIGAVAAVCGALAAGSVAVVAANPAHAAACDSVEYDVANEWASGHQAAVSVTAGSDGIDGWTLEFELPGGAEVQSAWNVDWSRSGTTFTGSDVGWNGSVPPGRTRELFGMIVSGGSAQPERFVLNGAECGGEVEEPTGTPSEEPTSDEPTGDPSADKETRTPRFMIDAGASTSNYVESEHFTVRWGDEIDALAWGRQHGYDNYPMWVADHMDGIYDFYVDEVGFVDPADHDVGSRYRINLYLCGTWSGDFLPPANWAGGDDIGVGHMCLPYDKTWDEWVESHEFAHILQTYATDLNIENGNGGGWGAGNPVAGPVWEAHANYMARMKRPGVVTGSGYHVDRQHFRWLAQETYYGDWMLFNTIRDRYGPEAVDRLWYEAEQGEHPIDTVKRVLGLDHGQFAELLAEFTSRQVVYDFADGEAIRSDLWSDGGYRPLHTDPLQSLGGGQYLMADSEAPHQYGHNIVRLNPDGGRVSVRLQGASDLSGADWRFRLAAVSNDFSVRYSDVHAPGQTADFGLQSGETHLMLVVAATPSQHRDYPMWETGVGDPFPYQLTIDGATPA